MYYFIQNIITKSEVLLQLHSYKGRYVHKQCTLLWLFSRAHYFHAADLRNETLVVGGGLHF